LQADRSNKPLPPAKVKPVNDAARVTGMTQTGPNVSPITLERWLPWERGALAARCARANFDARAWADRGKGSRSICRDKSDFASG